MSFVELVDLALGKQVVKRQALASDHDLVNGQ